MSEEPSNSWLPPFIRLPLLEKAQCRKIIEITETHGRFLDAKIIDHQGQAVVDREFCSIQLVPYFPTSEIYQLFAEAIRAKLAQLNARYGFDLYNDFQECFPVVQVMRYETDSHDHFNTHRDLGGVTGAYDRKLTLVVPLNSPSRYEGGRLKIHLGQDFDALEGARAGEVIVFPSFTMHTVTPVTQGTRYVAVAWLKGPKFR